MLKSFLVALFVPQDRLSFYPRIRLKPVNLSDKYVQETKFMNMLLERFEDLPPKLVFLLIGKCSHLFQETYPSFDLPKPSLTHNDSKSLRGIIEHHDFYFLYAGFLKTWCIWYA